EVRGSQPRRLGHPVAVAVAAGRERRLVPARRARRGESACHPPGAAAARAGDEDPHLSASAVSGGSISAGASWSASTGSCPVRSEEHTSELQSRENLVCRLLLE